MNDSTGRMIRSALQFVAGGGLTLLISSFADGLSSTASATLLAFNTLLVIVAQNFLESKGLIKPILKPAASLPVVGEIVDSAGTVVGGVVGATLGEVNEVAGTIIDDVGDIIGAVGPKDEETGDG